jgi:hypothetical protein
MSSRGRGLNLETSRATLLIPRRGAFLSLVGLSVPLMLTIRPMKSLIQRWTMPLGLIRLSTMRSHPILKGMLSVRNYHGGAMDLAGGKRNDGSQLLLPMIAFMRLHIDSAFDPHSAGQHFPPKESLGNIEASTNDGSWVHVWTAPLKQGGGISCRLL